MEHTGLDHRELPSASYQGIRLGSVCSCDLQLLYVARIVWPELEAMLTPIPGLRDKGHLSE